jgi:hypothetical protein
MARMSIDDKFLRDPRVVKLGRRFGWSRRETMGALLDVFALTYDQESDTLSPDEIDIAANEAGFADAMIAVDLADRNRDGVRIKGAAERISYLSHKVEAGRIGGRKSGETRRKKREAQRSSASEANEARGNPPDPVPDLPPDPVPDQIQDPTLPRAIPGPRPAPTAPKPLLPASHDRADRRRRLIYRAWTLAGEAFGRVQVRGIDTTAPNGWAGMPSSASPPMVNLIAIVDELLIGERPDFDAAEAKIANRIAVAEAEALAMSPQSARYMTPARMWNRESFSIAVDLSPEQAARGRGPPRGAASREKDPRVGRLEPREPWEYPDGDQPL